MPTKAKKTSAQFADLNVVSAHPLEQIRAGIAALPDDHIDTTIIPVDDDTLLFRIDYTRDGRHTASLNGRLRRWAGDMTHVYCDGRAFVPTDYWAWLRGVIIAIFLAPFAIAFLFFISGSTQMWLRVAWNVSLLLWVPLILFGGLGLLVWIVFRQLMNIESHFDRAARISPERKDRERLLDALTHLVADHSARTDDIQQPDAKPLSEEEAQQLIEDAERRLRMGTL